jgi:hypothetical protein
MRSVEPWVREWFDAYPNERNHFCPLLRKYLKDYLEDKGEIFDIGFNTQFKILTDYIAKQAKEKLTED